jgi:hypothetical protein
MNAMDVCPIACHYQVMYVQPAGLMFVFSCPGPSIAVVHKEA